MGRQLDRCDPREGLRRRPARGVGGSTSRSPPTDARREVEDSPPAALADHHSASGLSHQKGPAAVDRVDSVPNLDPLVQERSVGSDGRIVHADVELPEVLHRAANDRVDAPLRTDVRGDAHRHVSERPDCLGEACTVSIGGQHSRPSFDESLDDRSADTPCRAGDDRYTSFCRSYVTLPMTISVLAREDPTRHEGRHRGD